MRAAWLGFLFLVACADAKTPQVAPSVPRFEDAIQSTPRVAFSLHPPALLRDKVYGPLLARASGLAAARSYLPSAGATALMAFERADEVTVLLWDGPNDALVALRGVPAELDAASLVDAEGKALWRSAAHAASGVDELVSTTDPDRASLFVLPERTWVMAVGEALPRARRAYALPGHAHVVLASEPDALAQVTLSGDAVREAAPRVERGALAPIGHDLEAVSLWLAPGRQGTLLARLSYANEASATAAQRVAREVVDTIRTGLEARAKSAEPVGDEPQTRSLLHLGFLAAATVERDGSDLRVRTPLPSRWLDAIAEADLPPFVPPIQPHDPTSPASPAPSLRRYGPQPVLGQKPGPL